MCGRFTLRTPVNRLVEQFHLPPSDTLQPRYNIAPTQPVAAVRRAREENRRQLGFLQWGLVPSWAKDPAMGSRMINARSETVAERPAFRAAFVRRRCIVLADGYYEWQKIEKRKQPYYIRMADERPFGMAGLWEHWHGPAGEQLETCTILTTEANSLTRKLHDRMPVILRDEDWEIWLDEQTHPPADAAPLLRPFDSQQMIYDPVSTHVNSPRHEDASCIEVQRELP